MKELKLFEELEKSIIKHSFSRNIFRFSDGNLIRLKYVVVNGCLISKIICFETVNSGKIIAENRNGIVKIMDKMEIKSMPLRIILEVKNLNKEYGYGHFDF